MKAATPALSSTSSLPLFVYGTLLSPVVMEFLIQRRVVGHPARLLPSLSSSSSITASSTNIVPSGTILQGNAKLRHDYSRHPVRGEVYPGLVHWTANNIDEAIHTPRHPIHGHLFHNLTEIEMSRLDEFEGDLYRKEICFVQLQPNDDNTVTDKSTVDIDMICGKDEMIQAMVYVWSNALSDLDLSNNWSYSTFERDHLATYL